MREVWNQGELIAIRYLQKHNYTIRETNFTFGRFWEIDIIAQKDNFTYFIEVKFRKNLAYGTPEESIIPSKLKKCQKTLEYYCKRHKIHPETIQFDVITILKTSSAYRVTHYKRVAF